MRHEMLTQRTFFAIQKGYAESVTHVVPPLDHVHVVYNL